MNSAWLRTLASLWGELKFFHVRLAFEDIDWDAALLDALPLARTAESPDDLRAAVETMIAALDDAATSITHAPEPAEPTSSDDADTALQWPRDDIALVPASLISAAQTEGLTQAFDEVLGAAGVRALILDLREVSTHAARALESHLAKVLDHDLLLPSLRERRHLGYTPVGTDYAYTASVVAGQAHRIAGARPSGRRLALGVIVGSGALETLALAAALQDGGAALVCTEDPAWVSCQRHLTQLAEDLWVGYPLVELVHADGTIGLAPDAVTTDEAAVATAIELVTRNQRQWVATRPEAGAPKPVREFRHTDDPYPSLDLRLLALFRLWNVLRFCYGYSHLLTEPWDEVLEPAIAEVATAETGLDYALALNRLLLHTNDAHSGLSGGTLSEHLGTTWPEVAVRFIDGATVVIAVGDGIDEVEVGDLVVAVDGEPVAERRQRLGAWIAASHDGWRQQAVDWRLLVGQPEEPCRLELVRPDGATVHASLPRGAGLAFRPPRQGPVFTVLAEGYGYVDLERLVVGEVPDALQAIAETPGAIFDLRGYPRGTAWALAPALATERVTGARIVVPEPLPYGTAWRTVEQVVEPSPDQHYGGKVVVLVEAQTVSQAEHTCLFLKAAADVTFVGRRTAGANGEVRTLALPGGLTARSPAWRSPGGTAGGSRASASSRTWWSSPRSRASARAGTSSWRRPLSTSPRCAKGDRLGRRAEHLEYPRQARRG